MLLLDESWLRTDREIVRPEVPAPVNLELSGDDKREVAFRRGVFQQQALPVKRFV